MPVLTCMRTVPHAHGGQELMPKQKTKSRSCGLLRDRTQGAPDKPCQRGKCGAPGPLRPHCWQVEPG